jgi:DNA-binding MarR family transcriptional regulator
MRRKPAPDDARVVRMSLTDKTYKQLANLESQQDAINDFIFEQFDESELAAFTDRLAALKTRIEKACMKVTLGI